MPDCMGLRCSHVCRDAIASPNTAYTPIGRGAWLEAEQVNPSQNYELQGSASRWTASPGYTLARQKIDNDREASRHTHVTLMNQSDKRHVRYGKRKALWIAEMVAWCSEYMRRKEPLALPPATPYCAARIMRHQSCTVVLTLGITRQMHGAAPGDTLQQ
ncbi:hypothetical protein EBH_0049030 [Eimeria brunetti]|uniref:Uncharacterized protein n=1 Tax=Eimeria brunetti TaxID=51314 RepID=U6M0B7_9EIME|nr:hypothetical protein EBH_0049030 [Eimeria brunetti]